MNSQSKILLFLVAGMVLYGGCAMSVPLAEEEPKEGTFSRTEVRLGFEPVHWDVSLGEKIKTTSVHSDDSGFLSGETATEPGSDTDMAANVGLFRSIGSEKLRVVGGLSCRWNPLHYADGYREGFYSTRQQVSDVRPASQGSFVFTQVTPSPFTFIPSVGLEGKVKNVTIGADVGFPYMEWEARSGHDRWGAWENVQSSSWSGFGTRYTGTLGFDLNEKSDRLFFSFFYEEYEPEFAGESASISGVGGFVGFVHRW